MNLGPYFQLAGVLLESGTVGDVVTDVLKLEGLVQPLIQGKVTPAQFVDQLLQAAASGKLEGQVEAVQSLIGAAAKLLGDPKFSTRTANALKAIATVSGAVSAAAGGAPLQLQPRQGDQPVPGPVNNARA